MSQHNPVDTPLSNTSKAAAASSAPEDSHDLGYDDLADEDWIDMRSSTTDTLLHPVAKTAHQEGDDHLVPTGEDSPSLAKAHYDPSSFVAGDTLAESASSLLSLPSDYGLEPSPLGSIATDTASFPLTLQVSLTEQGSSSSAEQQHQQQDDIIPGSATPSNSESEYSLLNPSSDQSRKNSLTGTSGFHTPTPTDSRADTASPAVTDDHLSMGSQQDDQDEQDTHPPPSIGVISPSFSDFVQVGSEKGDNLSISPRFSNNQTPSSTSSEGKARTEDMNYTNSNDDAAATTVAPVFSTTTSTTPDPTLPSPSLPAPAPSPVNRNRYRTTVEDARSSSEEERELAGNSSTGMRYRGPQARQDDRNDIRNSFFGAARATSTMPGGLNLGLDADIDHFSRPAPQPTAVPPNDPPVDERQCRICLGGADEEDTLGRLISPCLCKGSMKYVHVECLNAWRTRSPKRESHYKCDTCKYEFSFRRTSFAKYLGHPLTVFVLTILVFALAVFAAGFAMKLLLYLMMDESQEFIYPADLSDEDDLQVMRQREDIVIFKTPESLRAVFRIDKTHMVFGSFFVSILGFIQLFVSTIWMGGGGGVFRIGGFGLGGGGRRRGGRGERQREAGVGGVLMIVILVFGLFKSVYMAYQFVNKVSRRVLAKAEMMVLEVQA
ncbi:hypothetical protein BGX29_010710 [Mortierella sp. GBA35]|nr:hypothetical protein BGX29_010710 [Mortierella sp. GBA35]